MCADENTVVAHLRRPATRITGLDVVNELRRVLVGGYVRPGTPIPADDVARVFGISRIPVREALKTLQAEGLLAHQPRGEYTVTELSSDELAELYLVRGALESAAITVAAQRATDADRERVRAALERELESADRHASQHLSRDFHQALLAPCRMPRLLNMLDIAWNLTEPAQAMMRIGDAERATFLEDHRLILDAFTRNDAETLRTVTTAHEERLTTAMSQIVDPSGGR